MKIGLVSAILPTLGFEELIDYAASIGFSCVEVCCRPRGKAARRYAGVTHIDLNEADDDKFLYYKNYALKRGVAISSLGYYPNPMDADKAAAAVSVEHLCKLINALAKRGIHMSAIILQALR